MQMRIGVRGESNRVCTIDGEGGVIAKIKHDYIDVDTASFVKEIDVVFSEQGIYVHLDVPDHTEPSSSALRFRASVSWESMAEDALREAVADCRRGPNGPIDMDELTELRDEWIAKLEKFIEQLRGLP